ncbi:hypothetical protein WI89_32105 [Burkholderia ubonensis]|nr:hypothetical protein WI89_32105 [Burkholderia ubonensis]
MIAEVLFCAFDVMFWLTCTSPVLVVTDTAPVAATGPFNVTAFWPCARSVALFATVMFAPVRSCRAIAPPPVAAALVTLIFPVPAFTVEPLDRAILPPLLFVSVTSPAALPVFSAAPSPEIPLLAVAVTLPPLVETGAFSAMAPLPVLFVSAVILTDKGPLVAVIGAFSTTSRAAFISTIEPVEPLYVIGLSSCSVL